MPGRIRQSDIEEVKARTNLADVVGDYVTLKSAGVGSLKGLCPFHDERSPSFHVRPGVGFYHCFGCGEGGDVYSFLQKMDHVSFSEAVERLAAKIGFQLHYEDGSAPTESGNRARLLAANKAAEEFFVAQLRTPEAAPGRQFLGSRGFDASAAERFSVGFAPKSYDALTKHLKAQGYSEEELLAAGLVGKGDRGLYDRFRGRLIWPIRDQTGQTVGFGARKLLDDDQGPKYLNTPDTIVYHKSQVLYGLDLARRDIARGKQVVVVEGYTDVMACHLAGVTTAVATCGTSFGVDHIKVIRRVLGDTDTSDVRSSGEVVFTFDPDEAGQKAASRAFAEEQRFAAQTFVAVAPEGLDPCDLRLAKGDDAVRRLVSGRKPMFEFMIRRVLATHDLETVEGRVSALRGAAPVVAGIRDQALSIGYVRNLAGWLGMDPTEVHRAVESARRARPAGGEQGKRGDQGRRPDQTQQPQGRRPEQQPQGRRDQPAQAQGGRPEQAQRGPTAQRPQTGPPGARPASGPTSGAPPRGPHVTPAGPPYDEEPPFEAEQAPPEPSILTLPNDHATRLERDALMAMLQYPGEVGTELLARGSRAGFINGALAVVRDAVATSLDFTDSPDWIARVASEVPPPFATLVKQLAVAPLPGTEEQVPAFAKGVVSSLLERDLLRQKADLLGALQRTDRAADPERYVELQRRIQQVEHDRRALRGE